jgi:hypothetical protein
MGEIQKQRNAANKILHKKFHDTQQMPLAQLGGMHFVWQGRALSPGHEIQTCEMKAIRKWSSRQERTRQDDSKWIGFNDEQQMGHVTTHAALL